MLEAASYGAVERFAKSYFSCLYTKQQVGTRFGRVDVMGLKIAAGKRDAAPELIAIEAKEEGTSFLSAIGQAYAYRLYAHRCYLAIRKRYSNRFQDDEIDVAAQLGVGLIEIKRSGCRVIAESAVYAPKDRYISEILAKMKFFRCALCRGVYRERDLQNLSNYQVDLSEDGRYRGQLVRALRNHKNLRWWLFELATERDPGVETIHDQRCLCKDCLSIFASLAPEGG